MGWARTGSGFAGLLLVLWMEPWQGRPWEEVRAPGWARGRAHGEAGRAGLPLELSPALF